MLQQITSKTDFHNSPELVVPVPPGFLTVMAELAEVEGLPLPALTLALLNTGLSVRLARRRRSRR